MPVVVAAPEIAFAAILFACFMLYALTFYIRNTTSDIVIVGGALSAALDWILDRIGELIAFFINIAANLILAFYNFWQFFVNSIVQPFVSYVGGILADLSYWVTWLKTTVGPAALSAAAGIANALAALDNLRTLVTGTVMLLIADAQNSIIAIKTQLFEDERNAALTAATVAAVVGTGVLAIPMTLPQLIARVQDDERIIEQQAAVIASQSAALVQQTAIITDVRTRLGVIETEMERVIPIAVVTALGAEAIDTLARLAKNPCLCFLPDMEMGWMVPVVVGLATDIL